MTNKIKIYLFLFFVFCTFLGPGESYCQFNGNFNSIGSGAGIWFSADSLGSNQTCGIDLINDVTELSSSSVVWNRTISGNGIVYNCDVVGIHDSFQWGSDGDPESLVSTNNSTTNFLHQQSHTIVMVMYIGVADPNDDIVVFDNTSFSLSNRGIILIHDTRAASSRDDNLRVIVNNGTTSIYAIDTDNTFSTQIWHLAIITFDSTITTNAAILRVDGAQVATANNLATMSSAGATANTRLGVRSDNPALLEGLFNAGGEIHTFAGYNSVLTLNTIEEIECWFQFEFNNGPSCAVNFRRRGLKRGVK